MVLLIRDASIADANKYVGSWHRHSGHVPRIQARFAYELVEVLPALKYGATVGVAIVGNPCGRPNDRNIIELRRVAFKPKENFGHYRRWYANDNQSRIISLRKIPVVINTHDTYDLRVISPREIPSMFVDVATRLVRKRMPCKHTIWTYTHETEKGTYLEKAGYFCSHHFTRRGIAKRRYGKLIRGTE
jgi:hypothetical protein